MPKKFPTLTVDVVILKENSVVLIKRKKDPFKGMWAIPGGFVEWGETVEEAAIREAKEETGLDVEIEKLLGVYSEFGRDPRGHIISVCFLCKEIGGDLGAATDSEEARWFKLSELPELAFDHEKILGDVSKFLQS